MEARGQTKEFILEFMIVTLGIFTVVFLLGGVLFAQIQPGLQYRTTSTAAYVSGYTGSEETVEIPSSYEEKPILGIDAGAFEDNDTLTRIILGENIESIGASAFENTRNLREVETRGESLRHVGESAFANTPFYGEYDGSVLSLGAVLIDVTTTETAFDVPDSIRYIAGDVLKANDTVEVLHIHGDVEVIEAYAFSSMPSLNAVHFPSDTIALRFLGQGAFSNTPNLHTVSEPTRTDLVTVEAHVFAESPWRESREAEGMYRFGDHEIELD